jgi:hypothetical protein
MISALIGPQPIPDKSIHVSIDGQQFEYKQAKTHVLLLNLSLKVKEKCLSLDQDKNKRRKNRTSSSGVKSLTMLKSLRISSGVLPLIMLATVLQPTSLPELPSIKTRARSIVTTRNVQQRLDIEVVGGQDNLEQHLLIDANELLVPLADVGCPLASLVLVLISIC